MRTLLRGWPTPAQYKADIARKREQRSTARIAKELGVTAFGLSSLGQAVATGKLKGGVGLMKLVDQGYATERVGQVSGEITDAGREVVRRARALGW